MKPSIFIFITTFIWMGFASTGLTQESRKPKCPQIRKTKNAPSLIKKKVNPLKVNEEFLSAGKELLERLSKPLQCKFCHGSNGDGLGDPEFESTPPARNFTCKLTMESISDGQLFWIIKNGSKGTSMPAYKHLSDPKIWQLIYYIRSFEK